jgi:hypothetical protein
LQADVFSCRDALDFNRRALQISNNDALFQATVDVQALILDRLRYNFAVANPTNRSYCWKALTTSRAICGVVEDELLSPVF